MRHLNPTSQFWRATRPVGVTSVAALSLTLVITQGLATHPEVAAFDVSPHRFGPPSSPALPPGVPIPYPNV